MDVDCMLNCAISLRDEDIRGKRVIEVGSYNVNGSIRPLLESYHPAEYIGVDMTSGPGVDRVCTADQLETVFGSQSFDVVVSTEMLEHVRDWREAVHNIKQICKGNGIIFLTTKARGFMYHGYPSDFWRFELDDLRLLFSDCELLQSGRDTDKGVFVKCRKPVAFVEKDLSGHEVYAMATNRRARYIKDEDLTTLYFKGMVLKQGARRFLHRWVERILSFVLPGD